MPDSLRSDSYRADAVNLARNALDDEHLMGRVSRAGIRLLCEAVMEMDRALRDGPMCEAADLEDACIIALAISGHFCANPDEWLRGHEKRLRELEKKARDVKRHPATPSGA